MIWGYSPIFSETTSSPGLHSPPVAPTCAFRSLSAKSSATAPPCPRRRRRSCGRRARSRAKRGQPLYLSCQGKIQKVGHSWWVFIVFCPRNPQKMGDAFNFPTFWSRADGPWRQIYPLKCGSWYVRLGVDEDNICSIINVYFVRLGMVDVWQRHGITDGSPSRDIQSLIWSKKHWLASQIEVSIREKWDFPEATWNPPSLLGKRLKDLTAWGQLWTWSRYVKVQGTECPEAEIQA